MFTLYTQLHKSVFVGSTFYVYIWKMYPSLYHPQMTSLNTWTDIFMLIVVDTIQHKVCTLWNAGLYDSKENFLSAIFFFFPFFFCLFYVFIVISLVVLYTEKRTVTFFCSGSRFRSSKFFFCSSSFPALSGSFGKICIYGSFGLKKTVFFFWFL